MLMFQQAKLRPVAMESSCRISQKIEEASELIAKAEATEARAVPASNLLVVEEVKFLCDPRQSWLGSILFFKSYR
jgi:hypothetical protein